MVVLAGGEPVGLGLLDAGLRKEVLASLSAWPLACSRLGQPRPSL